MKKKRAKKINGFEQLEERRLMAAPSSPRSETLAWLDRGERAELLARMTNLSSTRKASLQAGLTIGNGSFDSRFRTYLRDRTNVRWFTDESEAADIGQDIASRLRPTSTLTQSNQIVDERKFPETIVEQNYSIVMSGNINFRRPGVRVETDFIHTLNRHEFWLKLVDAHAMTGDAKFLNEIRYQLADWSDEYKTLTPPSDWIATDRDGWLFDTAIRGEQWAWTLFNSLSSSVITPADNTLFVYKLMQHGDWLFSQANSSFVAGKVDSNHMLQLGKTLHLLGTMFPEIDTASSWADRGRALMFQTMRAQVYADGSHIEQSPGYQLVVLDDMVESYQLDIVNGKQSLWSESDVDLMQNTAEAYRQMLTPDGRRPAISDTYRVLSMTHLVKTAEVLGNLSVQSSSVTARGDRGMTSIAVADASQFEAGEYLSNNSTVEVMRVVTVNTSTNRLTVERAVIGTEERTLPQGAIVYGLGNTPLAKPRTRDLWLFGRDKMTPLYNLPAQPTGMLGARGKSFLMPDSGNAILRSDDSPTATQIFFDNGPKGDYHGHHDPLNFELWSGGRALIADPGAFKYDNSADRNYVRSTVAHNTINIDRKNTGEFEDPDGTGPLRSPAYRNNWQANSSFAMLNSTHYTYGYLPGTPLVSRSMWYNYSGTVILVDRVEGGRTAALQQSFNLPATTDANTTGTGGGDIRTRYTSGDNVQVKPIFGGTVARVSTFITRADPGGDYKTPAYRMTVTKNDDAAVFVTLINVYDGSSPTSSASVISGGVSTRDTVVVRVNGPGGTQDINFAAPSMERLNSSNNANAQLHDIAFDKSGNLHAVWVDRTSGALKYSVRDAGNSQWGIVQTLDDSGRMATGVDLAMDNSDRPAVAYFNETAGDLKYAQLSVNGDAWQVHTVDSKGTVGQFPSLTHSRRGGSAIISYYDRTNRDLKVATRQGTTTWTLERLDSTGDVGKNSRISLDANRPDTNARYVVAYEDSTSKTYKYAWFESNWRYERINPGSTTGGVGNLSLTWQDTGTGSVGVPGSSRFQPRLSFYTQTTSSNLMFASRANGGTWGVQRVAGAGPVNSGLFGEIGISSGRSEIFYTDSSRNAVIRARIDSAGKWTTSSITPGLGDLSVDRFGTRTAVASIDPTTGRMAIMVL
jgi:Heparinase II/III N-terminus/Heparinase II/III-like protein